MKNRRILIGVLLTMAIVIAVLFTGHRYYYGNWNILIPPERIDCFDRRYYRSIKTAQLTGTNRPAYAVNTINPSLKIYLKQPRGKYVPTVIYLHLSDDTYLPYALSGGP